MQYSVLLVDAKEHVRKDIAQKLVSHFDNLTIVGEASDGEEALFKTETLRPDIVILDYQLTKLDGFAFIEQTRLRNLNIHFIIISESDAFRYVQQALRQGVHDYLLHPMKEKEFYAAVENACRSIGSKQQQISHTCSAYFLNRCTAWSNVAKSEMTNDRLCRAMAKDFQIPFSGPYFTFLAFSITSLLEHQKNPDALDLAKYALSAMVSDYLSPYGVIQCFYYEGNGRHIYCIINHLPEKLKINDVLDELLRQIHLSLHLTCVCAISTPCRHFPSLKDKCRELEDMIDQSICLPGRTIICKQDLRRLTAMPMQPNDAFVRELLSAEESNSNDNSVSQLIDQYLHEMIANRLTYQAIVHSMEMLLDMCRKKMDSTIPEGLSEPPFHERKPFGSCHTMQEFSNCAASELSALVHRYENTHLSAGKKIVATIRARLEKEYDKDIKLSFFASTYYINQSYLSTLFQQETGVNYSQYLTNIRLKKAKELLETTSYSTGKIAELVGYNDRNYFASVFSRKTGMTPMQYRASKRPRSP